MEYRDLIRCKEVQDLTAALLAAVQDIGLSRPQPQPHRANDGAWLAEACALQHQPEGSFITGSRIGRRRSVKRPWLADPRAPAAASVR